VLSTTTPQQCHWTEVITYRIFSYAIYYFVQLTHFVTLARTDQFPSKLLHL